MCLLPTIHSYSSRSTAPRKDTTWQHPNRTSIRGIMLLRRKMNIREGQHWLIINQLLFAALVRSVLKGVQGIGAFWKGMPKHQQRLGSEKTFCHCKGLNISPLNVASVLPPPWTIISSDGILYLVRYQTGVPHVVGEAAVVWLLTLLSKEKSRWCLCGCSL